MFRLSTDYSWIRVGRRVKAEWGTDGDFVKPNGDVIHVGENHTLFMRDHPEMFGDAADPDDMVDQGWVKTRTVGWIYSIDAAGGMNTKQLNKLQEMVRERCRYSDPHIQVSMRDSNLYDLACDDFALLKYPDQIKRHPRSA